MTPGSHRFPLTRGDQNRALVTEGGLSREALNLANYP